MQAFIIARFLVTAIVASFFMLMSESCSCMPSHPQEQYCRADFVILARIKREINLKKNDNLDRVYKVRIRKEFKMSDKAREALKWGRILTPRDDGLCGVKYDVGKLYVITGQVLHLQARVSLCGMHELWQKFTRRQRKGLKMMYAHGCHCKIQKCRHYMLDKTRKSTCYHQTTGCQWINWEPDLSDCFSRFGICHNKNRDRQCRWGRNKDLFQCRRGMNQTISLP